MQFSWRAAKHHLVNRIGAAALIQGMRQLSRLSVPTRHHWGNRLGHWGMRLCPAVRRITEINLNTVWPSLPADERQTLLVSNFQSLGQGITELAMAWFATDAQLAELELIIQGREHLTQALQRPQGVLAVGIHMHATELIGRLFARQYSVTPIYQTAKLASIERYLIKQRAQIYPYLLGSHQLKAIIRHLRAGHLMWMAPDQVIERRPLFVPLMGKIAATSRSPWVLAQLGQAILLPVEYYRRDEKSYMLACHPPYQPTGDLQHDGEQLNHLFSTWIQRHPEQYLWQYKRFKHAPPGATAPY